MITFATLLWDPNPQSKNFSRCYDEQWVERLSWAFRRNCRMPSRFVLFTDRSRDLPGEIVQRRLSSHSPGYGDLVRRTRPDRESRRPPEKWSEQRDGQVQAVGNGESPNVDHRRDDEDHRQQPQQHFGKGAVEHAVTP